MKIWAKTENYSEGKFLVVRRDGSVPAWPHFVLGARDPAAEAALRAYADTAESIGYDAEFVASVRELADDFVNYRIENGMGDADAGPHRQDDPNVIAAMRRQRSTITVFPSAHAGEGGRGKETPARSSHKARSCSRHKDCNKADKDARSQGRFMAEHSYDGED